MVEGTNGAARLVLGVNLDYPTGSPDEMEVAHGQSVDAGAAPWVVVHRGIRGTDVEPAAIHRRRRSRLVSPVEDTIKTMALVEACYQSSERGGTPIPDARL